jgi:hypothetical protein
MRIWAGWNFRKGQGIFEPAPDEKIFANEATSAREKLARIIAAEVAAMENNAAPTKPPRRALSWRIERLVDRVVEGGPAGRLFEYLFLLFHSRSRRESASIAHALTGSLSHS